MPAEVIPSKSMERATGPSGSSNGSAAIRPWLLGIITLGLFGSTTELLLLGHYEEPTQVVPLALMGLTLVAVGVHVRRGSAATVRLLRPLMVTLVLAGLVGIVLHFRGNMEFQLEMDPTQSGWPLVEKILHAKAPPALAPGALAQLGLLGLLYTYRHPALSRRFDNTPH